MADISKVTLPNNETYDLKDSVARGGIGNAKLFYGTCSSAAAATEKAVTCSEFTANDLVAGTMINVKFDATNSGAVGSLTLNVNGTGAKSIKYIYNNERNNIPAAGYLLKDNMYTFRYDGTYWVAQLMYNTNTTTGYGYYDYYFRACAGTSAIYRYKIVGMGEDNRLYPIVTTNQTSATQVAKEVQTNGIRPGHLWIYYSTTTASAGGAIAAATLLAGGGANTVGAYSFNESIPTYRTIYLRGTYDREKDLFYLYDDGTTPCKSYYTFVPTNSAVTLSDYFVEGNYYMIVGGSYSSENYFSIFADNPLYYFDGTNLIPVSTKVAKDEITSMVGTDEQEDNAPYSFRKTANGKISGSPVAAYDEIVGGSVVWNQLVQVSTASSDTTYGVTFTNNADGSWTLNGTATAGAAKQILRGFGTQLTLNHIYLLDAGTDTLGVYVTDSYSNTFGGGFRKKIWKYEVAKSRTDLDIYVSSGTSLTNEKVIPQVIDLTAALTPTIADYIYTLEQANTGAGVAYFKKYFPKEYHEFCEPHFEHVQTSGKVTVGFNQWDEEWEVGGYVNGTGEPWTTSDRIRSKSTNYIPVLGGQTYFSKCSVAINYYFYDESKTFISYTVVNSGSTFTVPSNARYIRFFVNATYGTTYKNDICINIHGDRDGEYEPYRKRTYPIEPKVLRGVPKLDSANRLYFDGDIYRHDGSGEERYGFIDLGTLNWIVYRAERCIYRAVLQNLKVPGNTEIPNIMTPKYKTVTGNDTWASGDIATTSSSTDYIFVCDTNYTDVVSFKTAMSGVYLLYELKTPEPFTAEPFQSPMVVDPLGTEEFVDYAVEQGDRDVAIPVGHNTKYRSGVYGEVGLKADTSYVEELVSNYVPTSRTINSKALTSDITLTASDVGALPANEILIVEKGGTGLSSLTSGSFLRANSDRSFAQRTPAQVLSDIGAAASGHTHTTTIASGGTSQINLAANTAYTLTAGGTNYVFKTPADSDTKNTTGSTDTSSEIYLVGATSQAANPQTYSHDTARVRANGRIVGSGYEFAVASAMGTTKATMVYDSTLEAIAFQFD